jgi:hypothetical protein
MPPPPLPLPPYNQDDQPSQPAVQQQVSQVLFEIYLYLCVKKCLDLFLLQYDEDWDDDVSEANQMGLLAGGNTGGGRSNSDVGSALDVNMAGKMGDGKGTVRKNLIHTL